MRAAVLLVLIVVVISCKRTSGPEGILSKADMVRVMLEIYVAEDKVQRLSLTTDSSQKVFSFMKARIESRTGIPDSVFRQSLEYYRHRPKDMESIYTALVDSLSLREQRSLAPVVAEQ